MHGAFDEASFRLARALRQPPEVVDEALQHVGVDAPYLGRTVLEGDPQGAVGAVSERLGVARKDLVLALFAMQGLPRDAVPPSVLSPGAPPAAPSADAALQALASTRLPRMLSHASVVALVASLLLAALGSLAIFEPVVFRDILVYAAAALVLGGALACALVAWKLRAASRRLRKAAAILQARR